MDGRFDNTLLLLKRETELALWLTRDPERRAQCLAHAAGHGLSYEGLLEEGARLLVLELAERFRGLGSTEAATEEVISRVIAIGAELGAAVQVRRTIPAGQRVPRWPLRWRTGAPDGDSLWPFDAELAGLQAGVRRLIKREPFDRAEAAAAAAWLERHDLATRQVGPSLLAASDPGALEAGAWAEANLGGAESARAVREIGALLGYPPCCVDAFARLRTRGDLAMLARFLPDPAAGPMPVTTLWVTGPLALISHTPCEGGCPATRQLATAVLAQLAQAHPGFAARWSALATAVHLVDGGGGVQLLQVEGALAEGARISRACRLVPGADRLKCADLPELAGASIVAQGGGVRVAGTVAALAADHRGAC